jgi:hypothetical protein
LRLVGLLFNSPPPAGEGLGWGVSTHSDTVVPGGQSPPPTPPLTGRGLNSLYRARLLARDEWGRETRKLLRFAFYIRSHLIRMPLPLLMRHLFTKWRK